MKNRDAIAFEQASSTDFELLRKAMEAGIKPLHFRVLSYLDICYRHGVEETIASAADWLGIDKCELGEILLELKSESAIKKLNIDFRRSQNE